MRSFFLGLQSTTGPPTSPKGGFPGPNSVVKGPLSHSHSGRASFRVWPFRNAVWAE